MEMGQNMESKINSPKNRCVTIIRDLLFLNFLWILGSIPIVTIGASNITLFYFSGKIMRGEEVNIKKDYIQVYKENLKQGSVLSSFLLLIYVSIYLIYTNYDLSNINRIVLSIIILNLFILNLVTFPILSRFKTTIKASLYYSVLILCKYPFKGIMLMGIFIFSFAVAYVTKIYIALVFSVYSYIAVKILKEVFDDLELEL